MNARAFSSFGKWYLSTYFVCIPACALHCRMGAMTEDVRGPRKVALGSSVPVGEGGRGEEVPRGRGRGRGRGPGAPSAGGTSTAAAAAAARGSAPGVPRGPWGCASRSRSRCLCTSEGSCPGPVRNPHGTPGGDTRGSHPSSDSMTLPLKPFGRNIQSRFCFRKRCVLNLL